MALNLSDIRRYAAQYREDQIPPTSSGDVRRPCLGEGYWAQNIETLIEIGNHSPRRPYLSPRLDRQRLRGRRAPGVTVNYHFSLRELPPLETLLVHMQTILNAAPDVQ